MSIDGYYCINLYDRDDRMNEVKQIFDKYNLPVKFFRVERDKISGARGCFTSHVKIINDAYKKNLNNVLIFEDDIVCYLSKDEFDNKMNEVHDFIKNYKFDILFLGSVPNIYSRNTNRIYGNIYNTHAFCTHAYILSRSGIEKFKNLVYDGTPIDFVYMDCDNTYAIYPSIFYQNESKSDIAPAWQQFFGSKTRLIKLMETYATKVNIRLDWPIYFLVVLSMILFFLTAKLIFLIIPIIFVIGNILKQ
ncbi:hypothetical protein QJ857_gp0852 [Tupanvirus soda lake]|uniref:Glycosyl transferase family 25 domain-containing protein n=2 Tax=Tupanvirus TaxID=2094720 RepID=A0A6N1NUN4_9VIRU|nr:hypothetical protein QJ857_gp0852 [Tupanvirus soda lake]QKU35198.1 hypothetical protein [Tupanvirus soda lake]